jgi:hypothetical protein
MRSSEKKLQIQAERYQENEAFLNLFGERLAQGQAFGPFLAEGPCFVIVYNWRSVKIHDVVPVQQPVGNRLRTVRLTNCHPVP